MHHSALTPLASSLEPFAQMPSLECFSPSNESLVGFPSSTVSICTGRVHTRCRCSIVCAAMFMSISSSSKRCVRTSSPRLPKLPSVTSMIGWPPFANCCSDHLEGELGVFTDRAQLSTPNLPLVGAISGEYDKHRGATLDMSYSRRLGKR